MSGGRCRAVLLAVLVTAGVSACAGASAHDDTAAGPGPSAAAGAEGESRATAGEASEGGLTPNSAGDEAAGTAVPPPSPPPAAPADDEPPAAAAGTASFPLEVTLGPACITRGTEVVVEVATRPRAALAAGVAYADDQAHGALTVGDADGAGSWRWTFVVEPTAPAGPAELLLSAQDRQPSPDGESTATSGEHDTRRLPFEVAPGC